MERFGSCRINEMGRKVSLRVLPDDLQVLILQILESCDVPLEEEGLDSLTLPMKTLPLDVFPELAVQTRDDDRDVSYLEQMVGQSFPPVVICNNQWIDGRHRVSALRKIKAKDVKCIDIGSLIGSYPFPIIAVLNLK
jgi:hypothetical protein